MPLFAGKEIKMDQQQNMELTKDQIIQELIALLNQNQQRETANNVFEMAALIDGMEKSVNGIIKIPTFGGENSPLCYASFKPFIILKA